MADANFHSYKQKHQLLFAKEKNLKLLGEWGRKLTEAGWHYDALDYFAAAKEQQGMQDLRRLAREEGDVFLFRRCLAELQAAADENEWAEVGQRALALGKWQYAREAFRMAGDRKSLDKVDKLIHPEIPAPISSEDPVEPNSAT